MFILYLQSYCFCDSLRIKHGNLLLFIGSFTILDRPVRKPNPHVADTFQHANHEFPSHLLFPMEMALWRPGIGQGVEGFSSTNSFLPPPSLALSSQQILLQCSTAPASEKANDRIWLDKINFRTLRFNTTSYYRADMKATYVIKKYSSSPSSIPVDDEDDGGCD